MTSADLQVLDDTHRDKIAELVIDERITLVRRYPAGGGKSKLLCTRLLPADERFHPEAVKAAIKGSGKSLRASFLEAFPDLEHLLDDGIKKKDDYKEILSRYASSLSQEELVLVEVPLVTGIDQSITELLPEPIFIPAVKDVRDELKTTESASFGKIIGVLMDMIQGSEDFKTIEGSFGEVSKMINRQIGDDGAVSDERLTEVREIEDKVGGYVREQFRNVELSIEIPPPSVRDVFRNARIKLHDGVEGDVDSKGDGVKRAVTFALLRTFVDLRNKRREQLRDKGLPDPIDGGHFLFLFEEPELYLHPNAQRILYDALRQIACDHQVCVCTHSPFFFSPQDEGTLLRLSKSAALPNDSQPPATQFRPLGLTSKLPVKDLYQILCYENNSAAFFCDQVLLVEGDCDTIFLQHVSRQLNPAWDFQRRNLGIVKVGGKGSFSRYRKFFEECGVRVKIVADLDVLADQFGKLEASEEAVKAHSDLMQVVDKRCSEIEPAVPTRKARAVVESGDFKSKYAAMMAQLRLIQAGTPVDQSLLPAIDDLLNSERPYTRRQILENDEAISDDKVNMIRLLREDGIFVLSRGAIEQYYPEGVTGQDKPTKALNACGQVKDRSDALACSECLSLGADDSETELEAIFSGIFNGLHDPSTTVAGDVAVRTEILIQ